MIPSKASRISSRRSTACGFSILARTGSRAPSSSITACTVAMSAALRTNDSAMRSARRRMAQRRSSTSLSDMAGADTATPGRFRPLWSETRPPSMTSVTTRGPSTATTRNPTLPSSTRISSPGVHVPGQTLVDGGDLRDVARHVLGGDREACAALQHHRTRGERAQPDLRSLQVDQDADAVPAGVRRLPHPVVDGLVVGVRPVAEVQARDVHPRVDQRAHARGGVGGRAQRADDLSAAHRP